MCARKVVSLAHRAGVNPGRRHAPREREWLFDIVRGLETRCCPHPGERAGASAPAKSNARARVSKHEGEPTCGCGKRSLVRLFPACYLQGALQLQRVARDRAVEPQITSSVLSSVSP